MGTIAARLKSAVHRAPSRCRYRVPLRAPIDDREAQLFACQLPWKSAAGQVKRRSVCATRRIRDPLLRPNIENAPFTDPWIPFSGLLYTEIESTRSPSGYPTLARRSSASRSTGTERAWSPLEVASLRHLNLLSAKHRNREYLISARSTQPSPLERDRL